MGRPDIGRPLFHFYSKYPSKVSMTSSFDKPYDHPLLLNNPQRSASKLNRNEKLIHLHHCRGAGWKTIKMILAADPSLTTLFTKTYAEWKEILTIPNDKLQLFLADLHSYNTIAPRISSISARPTGCRYAITASVSSAAAVSLGARTEKCARSIAAACTGRVRIW